MRWYDCMSRPEPQGNGDILWYGSILEITDKKEAEEELLRMQSTVDQAVDAIYRVGAGGELIYCNHATSCSLGYTMDELLSMTVFDIEPELRKEAWQEHWRKTRETGHYKIESFLKTKDGRTFPVDIVARFISLGGKELHYLSTREKSASGKRPKRHWKCSGFASTKRPDAVHWIDKDGTFPYVNEQTCKSLGYTREGNDEAAFVGHRPSLRPKPSR